MLREKEGQIQKDRHTETDKDIAEETERRQRDS